MNVTAKKNARTTPARQIPVPAGHRIAVLVPCYNEEIAIPKVIAAFRKAGAVPADD